MMKMRMICFILFFLFTSSMLALAAEHIPEGHSPLPGEHVRKLERIAQFIAGELQRRSVKSVTVEDFTDFYKRPSATGTNMAREFSRLLAAAGDKDFSVLPDGGEAVVTGILVPFRTGGKLKLDIKVVSSDKSKIITVYTGIFKKARTTKK